MRKFCASPVRSTTPRRPPGTCRAICPRRRVRRTARRWRYGGGRAQRRWGGGGLMERFGGGADNGQPGCILVASATFREGFDVPGEALQLVVIDKLPFPPP